MTDAIITMRQTLGGQSVDNVVCFNNIVDVPVELQAFADALRTSWEPMALNFLSQNWSLDGIDVSFLGASSVLYSVSYSFTSGPLVGSITTDRLPPTVALLVSTGFVGVRPNRGRIYLAGLTEGTYNSGSFASGVRIAAEDMVNGWATGVTTAYNTHFLRILRRPSTVFPSYTSNQVQTVVARSNEANQRRRRAGSN